MNNIIRNNKRIFNSSDGSLSATISILSNNVYKVTYYEIVTGASGTLTLPTGATINSGEFSGANCVLSEIDGSNKPTYVTPQTAGGTPVTATLNTLTGAWVKSGITVSANVALIYSVNITALNYQNLNNFYIIENILMSTFSQVLSSSAISSVTSSQLAGVISDETGSGALVFGTSPTFTTSITTPQIYLTDANNWITGGGNQVNVRTQYQLLLTSSLNTMAEFNVASVNQVKFTPYAGAGSARQDFTFITAAHTNQTASTNIPNFKVTGSTKTWAAGTLATQYFNYFSANTVAFASASTATDVFGLYCETPLAGTNATITNPYAIGTNDGMSKLGKAEIGTWDQSSSYFVLKYLGLSSSSSYALVQSSVGTTALNSSGITQIAAAGTARLTVNIGDSLSTVQYDFTPRNRSTLTLSTEIPLLKVGSSTTQWSTGAITNQRFIYLASQTASFVGASTITNSYGLYVEAATAGTNATITNNYAAGLAGNLHITTGGDTIYMSGATNTYVWGATNMRIKGGGEVFIDANGVAAVWRTTNTLMQWIDGLNMQVGTTTGTKIGTATTQKLAFWNATPIVQPTTAYAAAAFTANAGTAVNDASTFDGYTIKQVVAALRGIGLLA